MTNTEREAVILMLATNPGAGVEVPALGELGKSVLRDVARGRAAAIG